MNKKQKITLVSIFAALVIIIAGVAIFLNQRATQDGSKSFQVEVISERDGYSKVTDCKSDLEYLGEYMRTFEDCEWTESDYGIYITGFAGMAEDIDNQYWWCVTVNGETSTVGADEIPLCEGDTYTFTLTQGW